MATKGRATLEIIATPELGAGAKRIVIDCDHTTTTGTVMPGTRATDEAELVRLLAASHDRAGGCTCTRRLRHTASRGPASGERLN